MSISAVTLISQAIKLRYPLDAVLDSVAPITDEIIVAVDQSRDDGTFDYVMGLSDKYKNFTIAARRWNWDNHEAGLEFAIQSNFAVEQARSDWILYIQADEILHEDDYETIMWIAQQQYLAGVEFVRLAFWRDLQTLRTDWTLPLCRMFRRGEGRVVGDSINCEVTNGRHTGRVWLYDEGSPRLFHYSRVGEPETIAARIQANDEMHHPSEAVKRGGSYDFGLRSFDSYAEGTAPRPVSDKVLVPYEGTHPAAYRKWLAETLVSVVPPGHPENPKSFATQ